MYKFARRSRIYNDAAECVARATRLSIHTRLFVRLDLRGILIRFGAKLLGFAGFERNRGRGVGLLGISGELLDLGGEWARELYSGDE